MYSTKGLNGDGVVIKYPKSAGFYIKIGTKNEIQFLWNKCKGWKQLTQYGRNL
jgi:hypothetical protein